MLQLREFDRKLLTSVESEMAAPATNTEEAESQTGQNSIKSVLVFMFF